MVGKHQMKETWHTDQTAAATMKHSLCYGAGIAYIAQTAMWKSVSVFQICMRITVHLSHLSDSDHQTVITQR